jgi:hypothetical protein
MTVYQQTLISSLATNASDLERVQDIDCDAYSRLLLQVIIAKENTVSAVEITPSISVDGTTFCRMTSRAVDSGAGILYQYSDSFVISENTSFCIEFDVTFAAKMRFFFEFINPSAEDKFQVLVGLV